MRSYTLECTYSGFDIGSFKGQHVNEEHLQTMGRLFVAELLRLTEASAVSAVRASLCAGSGRRAVVSDVEADAESDMRRASAGDVARLPRHTSE